MIPEIKKVLFTSDLTDNSKHAFAYAASLASRFCAKMVFLYVMEDVPHSAKGFLDQEILNQIRNRALDSAKHSLVGKRRDMATIQSELNRFCELAQKEPQGDSQFFVTSEVVVTEGNVVDEILRTAEAYECDTIVMGSDRHGAFTRAMLGSVVNGVLRRSNRLVVVAPPVPKQQ